MAAAEKPSKLPLPSLAVTAYTAKQPKRKRTSEEKKQAKRLQDQRRNKCKVNLGQSHKRWRNLRDKLGLTLDSQLAALLLDRYFQTESGKNVLDLAILDRSSSAEANQEDQTQFVMCSSDEEQKTDSSATLSISEQELNKEAAICQRLTSADEQTANTPRDKEKQVKNEDEEFSPSLSVVDGRHQVDLGSSSEFIVDEQCILDLLTSCRKCDGQCTVTKRVNGLKIAVFQECLSCESHLEWTNLPDDNNKETVTL